MGKLLTGQEAGKRDRHQNRCVSNTYMFLIHPSFIFHSSGRPRLYPPPPDRPNTPPWEGWDCTTADDVMACAGRRTYLCVGSGVILEVQSWPESCCDPTRASTARDGLKVRRQRASTHNATPLINIPWNTGKPTNGL